MARLFSHPSLIEYRTEDTCQRFLITDAPNNHNLPTYIRMWKNHHVSHLVRVCELSYTEHNVRQEGIHVHHFDYPDGSIPSIRILRQWRDLCSRVFIDTKQDPCIGIHCIAGLGRAPLLVCIALIDAGMDNLDAISLVRLKRPGSINSRQLQYLKEYRRPTKVDAIRCQIM